MHSNSQQKISNYFNIAPELLPHFAELLQDIWELGSSPDLVVDWVRKLNLPVATTTVLDLGCGKGAIPVTLASEFGFTVYGVDFYEPFLREARAKATEYRVDHLCQFIRNDIRTVELERESFSLVTYTAVGDIFGSIKNMVTYLRSFVKPGGYLLIDDGFLPTDAPIDYPGYETYLTYDETILALTYHGDTILREKIIPFEKIIEMDERYTNLFTKRAREVISKHPELTDAVQQFLKNEETECALIEKDVVSAVWLLHKK